ncbi:hypothetical protein NQ314_004420 [Rhamnusium bicolor]|uniref:Gamma-interferon-inducible lysosomal thiol reductase n=1 Tax=Rhamnusium bicolor TaxID=1586634 RepID=A0AAV8ZJU7_9CUCU|nr:hypothetical protein NQ314_004420 [Rhamnusium bicolor]
MNTVLSVFTVFILAVLNVVNSVKVSIYYEALCPDSKSFIARQLHPNYKEIANYVDLDLIPYGKAIHNKNNGKWEFSCQHGPPECRGNKYQSCILSLKNGAENDVQCARRFGLNIQKIRTCASSDIGEELLALNGDKTWKLEPTISFVPTIVYDDKFDQLSQDLSLMDFIAVVCRKLNETKPTICNNRPLPKRSFWAIF